MTASDGTSTRTDYVYDGSMVVEEVLQHFSSSGTALDTPTTVSYLQGPSGPLYRKSSAEADPHWYVYDGLGSVVGELDVNGNLTASKLFDVYGLTRSVSGTPTTRQGFVGGLGHESDDETGLVYMRARYYDPGTGRFVSEDSNKVGSNWYNYCNSDPVNKSDYSGHDAITNLILWMCYVTFMNVAPFSNAGDNRWSQSTWAEILRSIQNECQSRAQDIAFEAGAELTAAEELEGAAESAESGGVIGMGISGVLEQLSTKEFGDFERDEKEYILNIVAGYTAGQLAEWIQDM